MAAMRSAGGTARQNSQSRSSPTLRRSTTSAMSPAGRVPVTQRFYQRTCRIVTRAQPCDRARPRSARHVGIRRDSFPSVYLEFLSSVPDRPLVVQQVKRSQSPGPATRDPASVALALWSRPPCRRARTTICAEQFDQIRPGLERRPHPAGPDHEAVTIAPDC